jgi:uncharacterized protein (DUF58 family)
LPYFHFFTKIKALPISFTNRFYYVLGSIAALFIFCWMLDISVELPKLLVTLFSIITFADLLALFAPARKIHASRVMAPRFSNGDKNMIALRLQNFYRFPVSLKIIEELPAQFQARNNSFNYKLAAFGGGRFEYFLRPVARGEYEFGHTLIFACTILQLVRIRIVEGKPTTVKVYPSFVQMRKYQLLAQQAQTAETGQNKIRRIGHSMEFDQIKEYVSGDDIRSLNWKATARRGGLMINHFTDERSQQVYAIIDKGRLMKMPFNELSLLDYAINSSLVLCNVCLHRQDRFGLVTWSHKPVTILPAERKAAQLAKVLETLYKVETEFLESDPERLCLQVRAQVKNRSLLVLFTNYESVSGMRRQLPYLRQLNKHHLLLVVFFENTGLTEMMDQPANTLEDVYTKTIAAKFVMEKRMIVKELQQHGILSVLSSPQALTVNTVNKYLELKTRQAI